MKKQAEEWLRYAYIDLLTIKEIITNENLTSAVAFHTQQCIEKSFKAIIELYNKKVPRIHDLRKLWKVIEENRTIGAVEINMDLLDQVNQVYIDTRYPADYGLLPDGTPSSEKAHEFMTLAEEIYDCAERTVNT